MINNVVLVGRIGNDPAMTYAQSGTPVCKFRLAVNRRGERDETDWLNIVCFKKTAEFVQQYLDKGSLVGVEGRIQVREYDDDDGKRTYWTEIVANNVQALESRADAEKRRGGQQEQQAQQQTQAPEPDQFDVDTENDPFGDQ